MKKPHPAIVHVVVSCEGRSDVQFSPPEPLLSSEQRDKLMDSLEQFILDSDLLENHYGRDGFAVVVEVENQ